MKVTNTKQLSAHLKDIRITQKLSQGKVASKVGIRQDTISNFEQHPDSTKLETFFKILSALNLELTVSPRNADAADNEASIATSSWKEEW
ncbi:XRE family transcriptional regulator [Lonsdalea britannica]|uniref:helix-turn-helix domain-containing protein n=1 Tax=Lonsdalea britannica TaxID=1082704 RepID=UPI000A1DD780|nr:helix-turn-helix domain-containing protein [Lonsdalea britannica]OSN09656.1 XRE family transcriptional regulator [Lonsdalea britannica]